MRWYRVWKNGEFLRSRVPGRFAGNATHKIFGRLTCKSGRRMFPENRVFFLSWEDAVAAGYRPCKACHPERDDAYRREDGEWRLETKTG